MLSIRKNNGTGTLTAFTAIPLFADDSVEVADYDKDGDRDGDFTVMKAADTGGFNATLGDFDGDGQLDIALYQSPSLIILRNAGNRFFEKHTTNVAGMGSLKAMEAVDLDARPGQEIVTTQDNQRVLVFGRTDLGVGALRFEERLRIGAIEAGSLATADVSGDGVADVLTSFYRMAVHRSRH